MIAFDTNILIYAEDPTDQQGRHEKAAQLLEKLTTRNCIVPVQVLGEFLNVCRKRQLTSLDVAITKIENYVSIFETPVTTPSDLIAGFKLSTVSKLQYFDALIIAVVKRAGATTLLSEDMQDGKGIDGLKIINPFAVGNDTWLADYFDSAP